MEGGLIPPLLDSGRTEDSVSMQEQLPARHTYIRTAREALCDFQTAARNVNTLSAIHGHI